MKPRPPDTPNGHAAELRRQRQSVLESQNFDVAIVGGGIYGACITAELARLGYRVCLVEASDFGTGTSSNSLRVLHGGLRYLQHLDLRRMRESIKARSAWLRQFPGLTQPQQFLLPTTKGSLLGPVAYRVALLLNDLVSLDRNAGLRDDLMLAKLLILLVQFLFSSPD